MVYETQYLVCKFGDSLNCGGAIFTPLNLALVVSAGCFFIGLCLPYFIDWVNTSSRKDRVEDMKLALKDHTVSKKR